MRPDAHTKKMFYLNFPFFEHIYTYRKKELQNILEKKYTIGLNSCYLFNAEHGIENEMDSAYGAFMH